MGWKHVPEELVFLCKVRVRRVPILLEIEKKVLSE